MKMIVLAITALLTMSAGAMAGSLVVPTTAPAPRAAAPVAYDWSGAYVGVFGGMGWGNVDYTPPGVTTAIDAAATYGGFAGYNLQSGSVVYGAEIAAGHFAGFAAGFPTESYDYIVDAKLRAGYAIDNVLVYGFGGYSFGHFADGFGSDWPVSGFNAGFGAEIGLTDNIVAGAEYIGRSLKGTTPLPSTQSTWINAVQARVSLRF